MTPDEPLINVRFGDRSPLSSTSEMGSEADVEGLNGEAAVNESIRKIARRRNTSVVVLDECHSTLVATRGANAKVISTLFKSIVNDGIFSLVLAGTEELRPILMEPETRSRLKEPVDFGRFSTEPTDIDYFLVFARKFELAMVKDKVIDKPIGLTTGTKMQAITYEMASGVIGTIPRILRMALERVLEDGRTEITLEDVRDGFVAWQRVSDTKGSNPFAKSGPKKEVLGAMVNAANAASQRVA